MKEYFKTKVPNTKEWVQMKALAIQKLREQGVTYDDISEIVGLSKTNCHRLKNRDVNVVVRSMFKSCIEQGIYPMKVKSKVVWALGCQNQN